MPSDLVDSAVEEFALVVDRRATGSASGAGVYGARTAEGRQVYLKATPAELGARALAAARRELNFYRQLATALPVVSAAARRPRRRPGCGAAAAGEGRHTAGRGVLDPGHVGTAGQGTGGPARHAATDR